MSTTNDAVRPETRERYLAIAAELARIDTAYEPAFAHIVSHITLGDVARHLGVSRSSLYRLWGTQHEYWTDLASFVMSRTTAWPEESGDHEPWQAIAPDDLDSLTEFLRHRFDDIQRLAIDDPYLVARASLVGYPAIPELTHQLSAWHRIRRQNMADRLRAILDAAGRTPISPLTHDDLAALVWLLVVGVALLGRTQPEIRRLRILLPTGGGTRPWTLLAYAIRSILVELTHPGGHASRRASVHDATPVDDQQRSLSALARLTPAQLTAIEAGAELFAASIEDHPGTGTRPRGPLGYVTLARVARAAAVSRRQLHHVWTRQEDLSRDLIRYLRDNDHNLYFDQFDLSVARALDSPTLDTVGLRVVDHLFSTRLHPPGDEGTAPVPIVLQPHLGDPIMREHSEHALARLRDFQQQHIDALAQLFGVRFRDGVTPEQLNWLIIAASNGSVALHRLDSSAIRRGLPYRGGNYSTLAIACQALIDHSIRDDNASDQSATA